MTIHFGLAPTGPADALPAQLPAQLRAQMLAKGATRIAPLFPGDTDAALAALYVVEGPAALLAHLREHPAVAFAEKAPVRR